jgi:uncharacterized protein YkwD
LVQEPTEISPVKRPRSRLVAAFSAFSIFALTLSTLGVVLAGPLTTEEVALRVTPSVAPVDIAPIPAVVAPTASPGADDFFTAPPIVLEPPPPPPAPVRKSGHGSATNASGGYLSYTEYCLNPAAPYSAGGSDPTKFLTLINLERARIGLGPLSWSGGLADSALLWSQTMAANDDAVPGSPGAALAHGMAPSPGGQNVATNWSQTSDGTIVYDGITQSGSINYAHQRLMYSTGHCLNILRPGFTVMGAGGVQSSEGVWYWTENFQ